MIVSLIILVPFILCIGIYIHYFPPIPRRKKVYDYAVVLGCPNKKDGSLCTSQKKRCETAIDAYKKGYYKTLCITGGTTRYGFCESEEMNKYIQKKIQIPYILETDSQTTIENFKFTHSLIGDSSILIITSQTHIKRACAIAKDYFSDYSGIYYPEHRMKHVTREIGARYLYIKDKLKAGL